jgi:drug/metabolite transporter (DMT)-like permease
MVNPPKRHSSGLMVILAFATVYIVWGSTYFFIQIAVREMPPMIIGAFRFMAAGIIMLVWCIIRREGIGNGKQIGVASITGLLMLLGGTGAVIWAEKWLPSSLVAILISSAPFWFVILDFPKWKENLTSRSILAGLFFGFIGVLMMFGERVEEVFRLTGNVKELIGLGILLFGTMSWAGGSLISKYHGSGSTNISAAWQMLTAGIAFVLGSLLLNEQKEFDMQSVSAAAWMSLLYLVVFGSLAAFSAYVWLLKVRPASQVSTYAYVNPVIAVLLGVVFAGERLSILQVSGLVVILASVLVINLAKNRKMKSHP